MTMDRRRTLAVAKWFEEHLDELRIIEVRTRGERKYTTNSAGELLNQEDNEYGNHIELCLQTPIGPITYGVYLTEKNLDKIDPLGRSTLRQGRAPVRPPAPEINMDFSIPMADDIEEWDGEGRDDE